MSGSNILILLLLLWNWKDRGESFRNLHSYCKRCCSSTRFGTSFEHKEYISLGSNKYASAATGTALPLLPSINQVILLVQAIRTFLPLSNTITHGSLQSRHYSFLAYLPFLTQSSIFSLVSPNLSVTMPTVIALCAFPVSMNLWTLAFEARCASARAGYRSS